MTTPKAAIGLVGRKRRHEWDPSASPQSIRRADEEARERKKNKAAKRSAEIDRMIAENQRLSSSPMTAGGDPHGWKRAIATVRNSL